MMSEKERKRKVFLSGVEEGKMSLREGSQILRVSHRQVQRIWKRYQVEGDSGLVHRSRGQCSNRSIDRELKEAILARYASRYQGFGPTLASEKLSKEGYPCHRETLRLWLKHAGLWSKHRQRSVYRKKRPRYSCFGALLQMDGSFHRWFGPDHPESCLMHLVDDATGMSLTLMAEQETTEAAMRLLKAWIERYGVPQALYVDLKTVYVSPKKTGPGEAPGWTYFSQACDRLGIRILKAYSPQAKGRVERKHAVYQDRFVKELALQGIQDLAGANRLLQEGFIDELNARFAQAAPEGDTHRPIELYGDLDQIFCWEDTRQVQRDWSISYQGQLYQLERSVHPRVRAKDSVTVRRHLDGRLSILFKGLDLAFKAIEQQSLSKQSPQRNPLFNPSLHSRLSKHHSPWSQWNPDWLCSSSQRTTSAPQTLLGKAL